MEFLLKRLPNYGVIRVRPFKTGTTQDAGAKPAWTPRFQNFFRQKWNLKQWAIIGFVVLCFLIIVLSLSIAIPLSLTSSESSVNHQAGKSLVTNAPIVFPSCDEFYGVNFTNITGVYKMLAPDNNTIDVYCDVKNGEGWTMVFKSVSGVPLQQQGPSVLWLSSSTLESSSSGLPINSSSRQHYKSRIIEHWQAFNPTQVRLSLYTNKTEVLYLVFNATGSTKVTWFSQVRLLTSPWTDLDIQPVNVFSLPGEIQAQIRRTFYINSVYGHCNDQGWLALIELPQGYCSWESHPKPLFSILYSPTRGLVFWRNTTDVAIADMMVIYLR